MPGCILTSVEAQSHRAQIAAAAAAVGSKIMPLINQFCESCGTQHTVKMEGEAVDKNYGAPPVEVNLTSDEEKEYMNYQHNSYCGECSSFHGIGKCQGPRSSTPMEFGQRRTPGVLSK